MPPKRNQKRKSYLTNSEAGLANGVSVVDLTGDEAQLIARQILTQRTAKKTRKIYKGKMRKWVDYFSHSYPDIVTENDGLISINIAELEVHHVLAFLGNETRDAIEIQRTEYQSGTVEFLE